MWTLIENLGCLRLSLRRISAPIWLIGKIFYFLDHWFIIINGPNTELCKWTSGVCFFHYIYTLSKIASSAVNVKIDWIQFREIAFLPCQGLFISFSFYNRRLCGFGVVFFQIKVHIIILFLLLLKNKPKPILISNGNNSWLRLLYKYTHSCQTESQ